MCGIEVTTEDQQIISIVGDKANPFSQGHVCPKATALKELYDDPDRIRTPMKKVDGQWQAIGWEEALQEAAEQLHRIQQQYGKDAVGMYLGNPNAHNTGAILYGPYFYRTLQSKNRFSATSVDQLPHHIVARKLFGHQLQIPIPDIDNSDYFMIIGGNPLASNGSIMTVPFVKKRLKAIQQKGGKVVVIDPKCSETAKISSESHFIRPGTDALLMLAMLQQLFAKELANPQHLCQFVEDWREIEHYVKDYTPERVSPIVGIEAQDIERMVVEFTSAKAAVCYGRMGASVQSFGTLTQYLIMLFNILTGNLDKPGSMMFTQPAADTLPHSGRGNFARNHSRVRGLADFAGELPVSTLAEEILQPGEGQIRAMVLGAGNPVLTTPNGQQLDRAFASLDYMIAVDFYLTESTRHADLILPPVTALERDHYDIVFHKFAVRNFAKFSPAVFPSDDSKRSDWQIYLSLAERLDALRAQDTSQYQGLWEKTPTGVVNDLLRYGRYGKAPHNLSIETLRAQPHGVDLGPLQPDLPAALFHENGLIDLSINFFMADLARLDSYFFSNDYSSQNMLLIGRRHLKSNNSWLHNSRRMVKDDSLCSAQLHSIDAQRLGIDDGQLIQVTSRVGRVEIIAEVTDDIMPGVISIPHGWGHDVNDVGWQHAKQNPGVNVNCLTDENDLDLFSGNAVLNGVPVTIAPIS